MKILIAFVCILQQLVRAVHLTSPVGRQVPVEAVRVHFPDLSSEDLSQVLVDITPDLKIHAHDMSFDVMKQTLPVPARRMPRPKVVIDGKPYDGPLPDISQRSGQSHVVSMLHGKVISVWGPTLRLWPLHRSKYPGVYINKIRKASTSDLDTTITSPDQDLDDGDDPQSPTHGNYTTANSEACLNKDIKKVVEFAVAADSTQCDVHGTKDDTLAAIMAMMKAAEEPYVTQTCLVFNIVYIEVFCDPSADPYAKFKKFRKLDKVLIGVRNMWNTGDRKNIHRDLVTFLPGFVDKTDTVGIAFFRAACPDNGVSVIEDLDAYVAAHEFGHNLGCDHVNGGIMQAFVPRRKVFVFVDKSLKEMMRYLSHRSAVCIGEGIPGPSPTLSPPTLLPTPSPSPSANRNDEKGTCAAGFRVSSKQGLGCTKSSAKAKVRNFVLGLYEVSLNQQFGRFDVSLTAPPKTTIRSVKISHSILELKVILGTSKRIKANNPNWVTRNYGSNSKVTTDTVEWSTSKLDIPRSKTSCCNVTLYLILQAKVKENYSYKRTSISKKGKVLASYKTNVKCLSCPGGIIKASATTQCPSCL